MDKKMIGKYGEEYACKLFISWGYKIVHMNFHSRYGEIDIIAENDEYIVFIEVKTRKENATATPSEAVTHQKRKKIINTAYEYLSARETKLSVRFDVVEVFISDITEGVSKFNHIQNAFYII